MPEKLASTIKQAFFPNSLPVWRIYFVGNSSQVPLISSLINRYLLEVNIFQANIETLKEDTLGIMDVTVNGTNDNLRAGIDFLTQQGVRVEILGYV